MIQRLKGNERHQIYPRITQKVNNSTGLFPLGSLHPTAYKHKLHIQILLSWKDKYRQKKNSTKYEETVTRSLHSHPQLLLKNTQR